MQQTDPLQNPGLFEQESGQSAWAWFDVNHLDRDCLDWHLANTPAQQAWLAQKLAEAEATYYSLVDQAEAARATAYVNAKREGVFERHSTKGGMEKISISDELAKYLSLSDPAYLNMAAARDNARYERDYWRGCNRAFGTKKVFLACLAGITRDELKSMQGV